MSYTLDMPLGLQHVWFDCKCGRDGCMFCDGGLCLCTVCNAFEGQLLSSCPGYKLSEEAHDAVYEGNVYDFVNWKALRNSRVFPALLQSKHDSAREWIAKQRKAK